MAASSWECKGCTNLCYMNFNGEVGTYCRSYYDTKAGRNRTKWIGDKVICLDYTTDPKATDTQIRFWTSPKRKEHSND